MALRRAPDLEVRTKSAGRPTFAIDTLARALAAPMSRRRAIGVISGTLLAGSALRPPGARAAGLTCPPSSDPTATLRCQSTVGDAALCVPPDWHCCSNPVCAGACKPWEKCSNWRYPAIGLRRHTGPVHRPDESPTEVSPKFCSVRLSSQAGICHDDRTLDLRLVLRQGHDLRRVVRRLRVQQRGDRAATRAASEKEYCESGFISESVCLKLCADGSNAVQRDLLHRSRALQLLRLLMQCGLRELRGRHDAVCRKMTRAIRIRAGIRSAACGT